MKIRSEVGFSFTQTNAQLKAKKQATLHVT